MFLGIDLGTSGIKLVTIDTAGNIEHSVQHGLSVSRPQPLWSEQEPQQWWDALESCMAQLAEKADLSAIEGIGLSGQMHGATLVDQQGDVIRPAILWNDGRSAAQCEQLERAVPQVRELSGNLVMPGFTAPKVLWVKQNEPDNFARIHKALLPKDYLRFRLSGDFASDMSDAAGTSWLDVAKRDWNDELLFATGLSRKHMPELFEGNQVTGKLTPELARKWGMKEVPLVAGGGDNAAGAVGVGIVKPGQAMLSLGTSGVYFVVADGYFSNPESAVHSFCHALPETWHLMSVILSAASCLQWYAENIAKCEVGELLEELESAQIDIEQNCLFLPYLSGERTPHNNPEAKGAFFGLTHSTSRAAMTHAVLEGVAFAFADGLDVLHESGVGADEITLIGGGSRSPYWRQLLADVLNRTLISRHGGDVGPALGAARLALLGVDQNADIEGVCRQPELSQTHTPEEDKIRLYQTRRQTFKALYQQIKDFF